MSLTRSKSRLIAISSLFAALSAAGAWISIPFYPVPLTLQTFFVYLGVLILGRYSFISQAAYMGMGVIGLPVFARGMSGYGAIIGPTGGYLVGFIVGSLLGGVIFERSKKTKVSAAISLLVCSILVFGIGWFWLSYWLGWNFNVALWSGVLPFLPGDCIKAGLAILVFLKVRSSWFIKI
ncbi:MAG: biotin transporter BioY [Candidatus Methanomethylicaceae archaeon]